MDGIVLLQAECKILLLFGLGMLLKKLQLTNAEADQFLSDLLMNVLMPMNIFVSFYQSMSLEELSTCGWLVPAGALVMAVVMLCARLIPASVPLARRRITEYCMLISNGSMVGIPLVESMYGPTGVFYANMFMVSTRILSNISGQYYFDTSSHGNGVKQGLKNFVRVLTGREFRGVLAHTFTYLGLYLPLIMAASVGEALILNKSFRGHGLFRTVCYTPVITSWVAAAVVWQWVLSGKYGLLNQMLAAVGIQGPAWLSSATWAMPGIVLASVWKDTGYYALMVLAALKSIDPGYYEAADLDGASGARKFFSITLPLISPTLFLLIVINIIYGLQVFDSVLIMTDGGPGGATTVFLERIYKYAFVQYKMGMASTYACILFVVLLLFTAVQFWMQKRWVNYDA